MYLVYAKRVHFRGTKKYQVIFFKMQGPAREAVSLSANHQILYSLCRRQLYSNDTYPEPDFSCLL
jgi:hypothetical protein